MKITLSDHAKKQRLERKIPLNTILDTLKNPERKIKSFRGRMLHQKKFNGKILEVVLVIENNQITVITEYYLER